MIDPDPLDILTHQLLSIRQQVEAALQIISIIRPTGEQGSPEDALRQKLATFGGEHSPERPNG